MKKRLLTMLIAFCTGSIGAIFLPACQNEENTTQKESVGLEYTFNSEGDSYILTGIGTCKDKKIIIPATYKDKNITGIASEAFKGCENVTDVVIPNTITSVGESAFEDTEYYNNEENWDNDVLYIDKYLIKARTSLSGSYTIKEGTVCLASSAFYECNSLTNVEIPNSLISISFGAFWGCKSLKNVNIPDSVNSIGSWAFHYCDSLTDVVIPDSVISLGGSAFDSCKNLTSVVIGNGTTNVWGKTFYNCPNLKTVKIGNNVKKIESEAFANCYNLTSLEIGSSVNFIGMACFERCLNLKNIYITDLVAWCKIDFRDNPLSTANLYLDNQLLTQLVVPENVKEIGKKAFYSYRQLTSVVIPVELILVWDSAFEYCDNLTSVYYEGTSEDWAKLRFGLMNRNLINATRYYYSENEPALNEQETAYDGNYWHYGENGKIVVWVYGGSEN